MALPVVAFCSMMFLFVIYAAIVLVAHYREANPTDTVRLRIFNVWEGDLPRIVSVPRRFFRRRGSSAIEEQQPMATFSTTPLVEDSSATDSRQKLTAAYARLVEATRSTRQTPDLQTTRF